MSRRRKKKTLQNAPMSISKVQNRTVETTNLRTYDKDNWAQAELILNSLLECNSYCTHGFCLTKYKDEHEDILYLIKNLPTLPYVMDNYMNFMFSNNLTTGNEEQDEKILKPFLYRKNAKGVTNYSVIREGVKNMLLFGKSGIRWLSLEDGIVIVDSNRYVSLMREDTEYYGFRRTVAYAMSVDETKPITLGTSPINLDENEFMESGRILTEDKSIMVVLPEDFINLRTDVSKENGVSRLREDRQRLDLLASVYQRLNYDIEYDGPGRLIFWLKDNFLDGGSIEMSANEVLDKTQGAKDLRAERARKEVEQMANQIKNSSSDNVILASSFFDDMDHIPRVTKATEFLEYLQMKEGSIVAQCLGITPELIGLGDVSGNVSMEKIIDNAMMNVIIPLRENIATQFSPMLSRKLGVDKIYFNKYEAQYNVDRSSERYKDSLSVNQLVQALQSTEEEGNTISDEMKSKIEEALIVVLDHVIKQS